MLPGPQSERLQPGRLHPRQAGHQRERQQAVQPVVPHLCPQETQGRDGRENRDYQITRNIPQSSIIDFYYLYTHNVGGEGEEGSVFASPQPAVQEARRVGCPHSLTPAGLLSPSPPSFLGLQRLLGVPAAVRRFEEVTVGNFLQSKCLSIWSVDNANKQQTNINFKYGLH